MLRRTLTLLLVALAAVAVGACGKKDVNVNADTEGGIVDIGPLQYQVQISRLLNPSDAEDAGYLVDLPPGESLGPRDEWFAVFMRVENNTSKPQPVASEFSIVDTQNNVYRPIQMGPKNVFVYRPKPVPDHDTLPLPDSAAGQGAIQGAMLLFKIPVANFANRPLILRITPPPGVRSPVGTVDLDV